MAKTPRSSVILGWLIFVVSRADDLTEGVMATGKHFVGHSLSQGGLNCGPVHVGPRELWDVFLAPFQAAIRDAGLASIMNAYPELDGEVVAASRRILTDLLRETLGFDGLVVSDYHGHQHDPRISQDGSRQTDRSTSGAERRDRCGIAHHRLLWPASPALRWKQERSISN